jgi:hypothetical protein
MKDKSKEITNSINEENKTISLFRNGVSEIYEYNEDNSIKVVISNGLKGMIMFSDNNPFKNFETAKKVINDTTGNN